MLGAPSMLRSERFGFAGIHASPRVLLICAESLLYCAESLGLCDENCHVVGVRNYGSVRHLTSNLYTRQDILECSYKRVQTQGEKYHTEGASLSNTIPFRYTARQGSIYLHRRRCLVVQGLNTLHKLWAYSILRSM
jgi:hypothetical protein